MEHDQDWIAQAIERSTGYFKTCAHYGSKAEAVKGAKYFRSVGYNARVFSEEEYPEALEQNRQERERQARLMYDGMGA
jgi:hypothetical protein